jgi:hypothetical protein
MERGPIVALPKEWLDDRSGRVLALWERELASGGPAELPWRPLDSLAPAEWQTVLGGARSVMVACTSRHPQWMQEAIAWSSRTARLRTYLFGPEAWVSSAEFQALVKGGASRLLARLGSEPPADWIVADRQRGWLVLGAPAQARRWVLPLTPLLAQSLHEAFVHLFWHHAQRESAPGGRMGECLPAPFPAPRTAVLALAAGQLAARAALAEPLLPDAELGVEPEELPTQSAPRLLLTPPRPGSFAPLATLAQQNTEVAWFDAGLPRLALSRRQMVVELGEGLHRLRLEFGTQEAIRMKNALELRARNGAWRFHPARALREVRGPVWLEGKAGEQPVQDELPIDLGDVQAAELLALAATAPVDWKEPPTLSRRIRYQWRAVPPQPPSGARPAELLKQWERLDSHVEARARTAVEHLEKMEHEERGLLQRLVGLLPRWDEVGRRRKRLRRNLDEIREQPLSQRPSEAARLLGLLEAQERELVELERFCQEEEEQEELRVAEDEQRAQHSRRVEQARAQQGTLRSKLEACQTQLQEKQRALPGLEGQLQTRTLELERAAHEARTQQAKDKLAASETRLEEESLRRTELQAALDGLPTDAPKDERKRSKGALHKQEEALVRLKKEVEEHRRAAEAPFRPGSERLGQDEELALLTARLQELRQELVSLGQREKQLQTDLEACAKEVDAPFRFTPPARPARSMRKREAPTAVPIPEEHPPEFGKLLEHANRRYLAVRTWEEAQRAKVEADRLRAMLVAAAGAI